MATDIWTYRESIPETDVAGFRVEATDGEVGKVDEQNWEVGSAYLVVETGPWVLGKKVMLPAATVARMDPDEKTIYIDRSREEVKNAPEFDSSGYAAQEYRAAVGGYYAALYT
jgi:hypothetical protein